MRTTRSIKPDSMLPLTPYALFDDNLDGAGDLLLTNLVATLRCDRPEDLPEAFERIDAARHAGHWIAIAARYELGYALEPHLHAHQIPAAPLLDAWIYRSAEHLASADTCTRIDTTLAAACEHQAVGGVADLSCNIEADTYRDAVRRIRNWIDAGDCYQVNFTFSLGGTLYGSPLALYKRLREAQPVRYGAFINTSEGAILSRSPELFVARRGTTLTCKPMKGTTPRTIDPETLRRSEKNRAENIMIVDLIRNDLGRLAPPGEVHVTRLCEIEPYPTVWQMTSTVTATSIDADFETVLRALFPCGSITGAPKIRAMEIIRALESGPRGVYCGALGWLAPDGDFRLSVPIRTLETDAAGDVRLGLGSGIVADSDEESEWQEALLKGRFLTDLAPQFGLIETLRYEPHAAARFPLLARHFARLEASARHFGFPLELAQVQAALEAHAAALDSPHRVRVELHPDGSLSIASSPLPPDPQQPPTVVRAAKRTLSSDRLLRHKTTLRQDYDTELQRVMAAGHFDALFFNERDELTEGARTNVFVETADGALLTPPISSGVLDGVYRRKLLDEGTAREAVLRAADLERAVALYLSNAARGLFRVRLVD